ncbi:MAG: hypothetical protein AB8G22_20025 [Saprospiraceae bacterium]
MDENKIDLEPAVEMYLEEDKTIEIKWDCGGDEAFVHIFLDGKELGFRDAFAFKLEQYLINFLTLPDAGEFSMKGEGKLIQENERIFIQCESHWEGYVDEESDWKKTN